MLERIKDLAWASLDSSGVSDVARSRESLKFAEALPDAHIEALVAARGAAQDAARTLASMSVVVVGSLSRSG